eukprot:1142729-Pelagomonas_calceolata.AAC.1
MCKDSCGNHTQVTGDALKLVCSFGRNTLRNRPAPYDARLNQQLLDGATCEFLMPPQVWVQEGSCCFQCIGSTVRHSS